MPQSTLDNTLNFGCFGKLPSNGDFFHRNLPTSFINKWDHWLQQGLARYQTQDPQNWLNGYLTSPVWRFVIPPSVLDENAYFGILGPSVDTVGRYFPMTFAANLPSYLSGSLLTSPFHHLFDSLENCFLKHLHATDTSIEKVEEDLTILSHCLQTLLSQQNIEPLPDNLESHHFKISQSAPMADTLSTIWFSEIIQRHPNTSIWWTSGSQNISPSLLFTNGLPSASQYAGMLNSLDNHSEFRSKNLVSPTLDETDIRNLKQKLSGATTEEIQVPTPSESAPSETNSVISALQEEDIISANDILSSFTNSDSSSQSTSTNTMNNSVLTINTYGFSDVGNSREQNQDAILINDQNTTWIVADGMGGHFDGDKASREIVDQLTHVPNTADLFSKVSAINSVLTKVNSEINHYAREKRLTCGSTVILLTLHENKSAFVWAGDSRLYLLRNDKLEQLTTDHSMYNLYKASGLPTDNIQHNAITRAIGVDEKIDLEVGYKDLQVGDRLLLCSDGLYDPAGDDNIRHALKLGSPEEAGEMLKNLILAGPAKDNLSGVFIWL